MKLQISLTIIKIKFICRLCRPESHGVANGIGSISWHWDIISTSIHGLSVKPCVVVSFSIAYSFPIEIYWYYVFWSVEFPRISVT